MLALDRRAAVQNLATWVAENRYMTERAALHMRRHRLYGQLLLTLEKLGRMELTLADLELAPDVVGDLLMGYNAARGATRRAFIAACRHAIDEGEASGDLVLINVAQDALDAIELDTEEKLENLARCQTRRDR